MKKYISALTGIMLVAGMVLTGCGKTESPETAVENGPVIETQEAEAAPETTENAAEQKNESSTDIPAEDPEAVIYLILPSEEGQSKVEEDEIASKVQAAGLTLVVKNCNRSIDEQNKAFDEAINAGARLIICDNSDVEQTTFKVESAGTAGIPVILMNRGIDSMGLAASQILTDNYSCVTKLGEKLIEYKNGTSNYIEVLGSNSSYDITEAFSDVMSGNDGMVMVRSDIADENDEQDSYNVIWEMLKDTPDADMLVCYNVTQTKAGISAAADLGKTITVVCLYGDDDSITELVNNGSVYATVVKPGEELARTAADQVDTYINKGELPSSELVYVQGNIISSNVAPAADFVVESQAEESPVNETGALEGLNPEGEEGLPPEQQ